MLMAPRKMKLNPQTPLKKLPGDLLQRMPLHAFDNVGNQDWYEDIISERLDLEKGVPSYLIRWKGFGVEL